MKEKEIDTVIDRLFELVNGRGRISVSEAAKALTLDANQVEKMALVLESNKLVDVSYELWGTILSKKKIEIGEIVKSLEKSPNKLVDESRELNEQIVGSENLTKFIEKDIKKRLDNAEKLLRLIERDDENLTRQNVRVVGEFVEKAASEIRKAMAEASDLRRYEGNFSKKINRFKKRLKRLEMLKAESKAVRKTLIKRSAGKRGKVKRK